MLFVTKRCKPPYLLLGISVLLALVITLCNFTTFAIASDADLKKSPVIILDAGHGGFDSGATSGSVVEKDINLQIALKLRDTLAFQGYTVIMTREQDTSTESEGKNLSQRKKSDMRNRLKLINDHPNAIFLSIHQNSYQSANKGSQLFYKKKNAEGELLAKCIQQTIRANLQPESHREHKPSGKEYFLLENSTTPGVLIECGFISNSEELAKLKDSSYQQQLALCIYQGLCTYLEQSSQWQESR